MDPIDDHNIIIDVVNYAIWLSKQQATVSPAKREPSSATINLPRVVGMTADAASALLKSKGFQVLVESVYSVYTDDGIVMDQSPSSGNAPIGLQVVLKVAYGKAAAQARSVMQERESPQIVTHPVNQSETAPTP